MSLERMPAPMGAEPAPPAIGDGGISAAVASYTPKFPAPASRPEAAEEV